MTIESVVDTKKVLLTYPADLIDRETEMALRSIHAKVAMGMRIRGFSEAWPTPDIDDMRIRWERGKG